MVEVSDQSLAAPFTRLLTNRPSSMSVLSPTLTNQQKVKVYGVKAMRRKTTAKPEPSNELAGNNNLESTREIPREGAMLRRPGDPNGAVGGIDFKYLIHVSKNHNMPSPVWLRKRWW